jgi:SAM-dependent methyltransferase
MKIINTGWERERRAHFDEIVTDYDKVRPSYPDVLYNDLFAYIGSSRNLNTLEIGAGTGKATVPVITAGNTVTAVELGEHMSEFLRERFGEYEGFKVITSSFENAELTDSGYGLIYAASAFHWVDAEIGCPKVYRLLNSGGVFALLRFNWVTADTEDVVTKINTAYEKHYQSFYGKGPRKLTRDEYCLPIGIKRGFGFNDMSDYGFTDVVCKTYDRVITYTADDYIGMLETMSDHRALPENNRAALYAEIRNIITKNGGQIKQGYFFQLYMGRKSER